MALLVGSNWDEEEWEICNDNGFVYKRRRCRTTDTEDYPPPHRPSDAIPEADLRRSRKKRCLLTLKEKYQKELEQWENLSSAITHLHPPPSSSFVSDAPPLLSPPQLKQPLIEELLFQVEAQESILCKLTELCDYVDSVCDAEEERMVKSLIDLPVWGNPNTLIASLSLQ